MERPPKKHVGKLLEYDDDQPDPLQKWGAVQKALAVFGASDVYRQKKTQEGGGEQLTWEILVESSRNLS